MQFSAVTYYYFCYFLTVILYKFYQVNVIFTVSYYQVQVVQAVKVKFSADIGAVLRIKKFVPVATLETVYKGLVQPYFENCSPLWETCGKLLKDKLQRFQSRAARVLTGASYNIRSADLIDSLSWQTLDDRRRCVKSILMYKII